VGDAEAAAELALLAAALSDFLLSLPQPAAPNIAARARLSASSDGRAASATTSSFGWY
jgi:hypothetical protein